MRFRRKVPRRLALPDITAEAFDRVFRGRPLGGSAGKRRFPYAYLSERARDFSRRTPVRTR